MSPARHEIAMTLPSPKQPWWRRWFGNRSERAAERFLKSKKHRILVRNWKCQHGELDLVTRDGDTLVFVEVRSTEAANTDLPALSVDALKQKRLTQLALAFMRQYGVLEVSARFDVITLAWPKAAKEPQIDYYPNAFAAVGQFGMYS
jgi:putative endonuclease